jgi:hypothetical protein
MDKPKGGLSQRIFAWALARFNSRYEQFSAQYKDRLFAGLSGSLLEIGPGTGVNLRYLRDASVRWTGVEPNLFMRRLSVWECRLSCALVRQTIYPLATPV